jgi:peroxidase
MMAAAWKNKHAALIITVLAFLAPMACHGGGLINFTLLCSGGWVRPITVSLPPLVTITIGCPNNGPSEDPYVPPSPNPNNEPAPPSGAGLYLDYYNYSCPNAETIVREVVEDEIAKQGRGIGAGLIRLHFHDCFVQVHTLLLHALQPHLSTPSSDDADVIFNFISFSSPIHHQGCDASVLLNTTASGNSDTEREGGANKNSLRGLDVIDKAKAALEKACPSTAVSCADILAFAARDAARNLSGGKIEYKTPAGRWDGRESSADETGTLPGPFSPLDTLVAKFADQGLNRTDLVLLSAAHSIGRARCIFRSSRPGMNQTLVDDLNGQCKSNTSSVNQDYKTPDVLDSQYYQNVFDNDALFDSDAALTSSIYTKALVETYRTNLMNQFEKDFGEAMVKMGKIKTKTKGDKDVEIRKQCWTYNAPPNY